MQPITPRLEDHESWERNETLERMSIHGVEKVRGWMYTTQNLSQDTIENIDSQLCEKYDLCRSCGEKGHFVSACPSNRDRKSAYRYQYKTAPDGENSQDSSCFSESSDDSQDSEEYHSYSSCSSDISADEDQYRWASYKRYRHDYEKYHRDHKDKVYYYYSSD